MAYWWLETDVFERHMFERHVVAIMVGHVKGEAMQERPQVSEEGSVLGCALRGCVGPLDP